MDIQSIISRTNLLALVEAAGASLQDKGRGRWRCCCPLHNGHDPSGFSVVEGGNGKLHWTCFSGDCGSGDVIDFVMKWRGLDFLQACQYLGGEIHTESETLRQMAEERQQKAEQECQAAKARLEKAAADLEQARAWEEYHANLDRMPGKRVLWQQRGVPDAWQDIWRLGYTSDFAVWEAGEDQSWQKAWTTPTLSIPVFQPGWKIATIRHRLLQPKDPGDKYRPERTRLGSHPFLANPETEVKGPVLVVEGEIKAMVAYVTADTPNLQVVGIPGKHQFTHFTEMLASADPIYILPDPDAQEYGSRLAQILGLSRCRVIRLRIKVDDAILGGLLDKRGLQRLIQFAPKAKAPMA